MRCRQRPIDSPSRSWLLLAAALLATTAGCTSLAEEVASHLVEKDVRSLDQEFQLFEADLGLFRQCLKRRGGSCQGSDTTALPHTSQAAAGRSVGSLAPGSSQTLADSVAKLPAGDPAKSALAVLGHPVVGQAAALHDHLRGHDTGAVPGFSVARASGAGGVSESTATLSLGLGQLQDLHKGLLSSLGTSGWESLHRRCRALLAAPGEASGRSGLEADCRRVAFIRGYLEAYLRHGEFLEVDLQLTGAIQAVNREAAGIESDIDGLLADLQRVESGVAGAESEALQRIAGDAGKVGAEVQALIGRVEGSLIGRFGQAAATVFAELAGLAGEVVARSEALAQAAAKTVTEEIQALAAEIEALLGRIKTELDGLESQVAALDRKVVQEIDDELGRADAALSNVFQVSNVGFVSRDHTFAARLPTLEVTLDPTLQQLVKVTDVDTGQRLSSATDLGRLGVATDSSGVGTGSSIGAEIARVFLEAVFDAHEGLPAVAPANQAEAKPTGLSLGEYGLPLFSSPLGNVDSGDLSRMTHTNDRVAAGTRVIVGRIIAGIGPFSLNNQPLEEFIVEIIATSVRKATAKATWCWYACNLDVELERLEADAKTAVADEAEAVEARSSAELEHLKLRLKLSR